ncbi:MAG: tRNA 2-thiouridine(34) synthase MnmA [Christensenellaceae bacterium]|jgi:tRNA-specific 2-thiouridylase|nr:tRNA 2-thiouridine(34) synthase MnmA [Christensenellaceae bacterium]
MEKSKIIVGMSGGVDSSVAALLLKKAGYDVIGLFMHNWHESKEDGSCSAEEDFADVRRVSDCLDIPYYTIDLSQEYSKRVFKLFIDEYKSGRTPNPDVLCNREIKFGPFKDYASKIGVNLIATGHYAGTKKNETGVQLTRAKDESKDQTYFLNQVTTEQLNNVIFPLTEYSKREVREIAKSFGLPTAYKKDSTGICFIGERNFRQFLSEYIPMQEGEIRNLDGKYLGKHQGVFNYTIGQRKGFRLGGGGNGQPYFVIKKDVKNNILYVNQGECDLLYTTMLVAKNFNYINSAIIDDDRVLVRTRHRQALTRASVFPEDNGKSIRVVFDEKVRAVTPGQYAVLYKDNICLGGGVID